MAVVVDQARPDAVLADGRACDCPLIEFNTPPADTWSRTMTFYKRHGFEDNGPLLSLHLD
tara:strand:- start:444 stop:623 length:180 start_codon:yes stop_codon:yes gene_type:complete